MALPYETWFNGDVRLQIENDTFPECREEWARRVATGHISQDQLDKFEKSYKAAKKPVKKSKK